jgi:hypothetical protein
MTRVFPPTRCRSRVDVARGRRRDCEARLRGRSGSCPGFSYTARGPAASMIRAARCNSSTTKRANASRVMHSSGSYVGSDLCHLRARALRCGRSLATRTASQACPPSVALDERVVADFVLRRRGGSERLLPQVRTGWSRLEVSDGRETEPLTRSHVLTFSRSAKPSPCLLLLGSASTRSRVLVASLIAQAVVDTSRTRRDRGWPDGAADAIDVSVTALRSVPGRPTPEETVGPPPSSADPLPPPAAPSSRAMVRRPR